MPNDGVGFFLSAGPLLGWARHGLSRASFDYILDLLEPILFGYTLTTFKLGFVRLSEEWKQLATF